MSSYDPHQVALYYVHLFPARNDVYSRWTPEGWRPVREPLTAEVAIAGLRGTGPSISGYMIAHPGQSHTFAVDFDREDGVELAFRMSKLIRQEMPTYVETSRRGAHLWGCLDNVAPARLIRAALRGMLQALDLDAHDPKIELRPGTDSVDQDGLGHALRLPLMPHPKTGKRGEFYDGSTSMPMGPKLADILLNIREIPAASLTKWAEAYKPPQVAFLPSAYARPHEPFPEDDSHASDILRELWGVPNALPGRSIKCPAHEDSMPSLSILRDDKRVICKAPHCTLNNNDHGRGTHELRTLAPHG